MLQAEEEDEGGFVLLWQHESGQYAVWNADAGGARTGGDTVDANDLVRAEVFFEADLDNDGNIGHVEAQIETDGDHTLLTDALGNYVVEAGGGARVTITSGDEDIGPRSYAGWQMVQAEDNADGGFDLLWHHDSGSYATWSTDAGGARTGGGAVDEAGLPRLEPTFETDLDGDGTIGYVEALIENNGNQDLYSDTLGNYVVEAGGGARVTITSGGTAIGPDSLPGWQMSQADDRDGGGLQLLWQHDAGHYAIWETDAGGARTDGYGIASFDLVNYEAGFGVDLDGDGNIGPVLPAPVNTDEII